ncbi:DUF397 domain-containing protein [Actinoplanes sp. Pm04-4]|uniref:DUF397 domain-containing protein n=2 Tax=Paractinoplanes pyxinae TaxID=2997416 RepID=A0ABT4AT68_9ACTN|nr:DUF397 domain-containing protein [Actinoplanes pyxinae]
MHDVQAPQWRRGSQCTGGNCIEVAKVGEQYLIRDSKNPERAPHSFTEDEWVAFVQGVNSGEFIF